MNSLSLPERRFCFDYVSRLMSVPWQAAKASQLLVFRQCREGKNGEDWLLLR